jgi:hypothetical protein
MRGGQATLAAGETVRDATLATLAMAGEAVLLKNLLTAGDVAAARRQAGAVRPDVDVPEPNLIRRGRAAKVSGGGGQGSGE